MSVLDGGVEELEALRPERCCDRDNEDYRKQPYIQDSRRDAQYAYEPHLRSSLKNGSLGGQITRRDSDPAIALCVGLMDLPLARTGLPRDVALCSIYGVRRCPIQLSA